jgi:DNA-binding CsgD family transcriptional regulator
VWSDELDAARGELEDIRQRAVMHGDESSLAWILSYLSLAECLSGRLEPAVHVADEGEEVALMAGQEIGRAFVISARALAESCLGREEAARSDAGVALDLAKRGTMFAEMTSLWALAVLELALDNPAEAHKLLGPLVERVEAAGVREPGSIRFVTDDVEALAALGELEQACSLLSRHEERARRLRRRSALAACARCRGLLAGAEGDYDRALASFGTALESYSALSLPLEQARTLVALGSVQRRAKQRAAARRSLEQALDGFDRLGARLWSEKTRGELARIGGRVSSDALSATEQRVAELVAGGHTNAEVAAELFLTVHTVEKALTRIYSKLGIRSRAELARKLAVKE